MANLTTKVLGAIKKYIDEKANSSKTTVDSSLSSTSTNPVQNKVIKSELDKKANSSSIPTSLPANGGNSTTANGIMPDWTGELGYEDTNWICAWQADGKKIKAMNKSVFAASNHTHNYAGSSSVGGAATSANKLNTNAGSSTTPTYFYNGVPVACTGISVATVTATTTLNIPGGKIWIE